MGSISNLEIHRMELMNTIAGIERYAASVGNVGMFITLTTPSKYPPTRQVGKGDSKTVQQKFVSTWLRRGLPRNGGSSTRWRVGQR
jgi:hypothetical protein